ncbi:hypothetical protein C6P45_000126 [Maudiozyma exigua]|uniref:Protein kinase domain-containing protein n=1 Tax=Maudiozyma exigua TaxID=34358 RepID=A0A9P7BC29_MAUEX|nr:hypothetical protein C6P45_000126 [Kazachstania exigua]
MSLEGYQVNNFQIIRQVGSGVYGLVFHVYDSITKFEFAMKVILKSSIDSFLETYSKEESEERNLHLQKELIDFFQKNQNKLNIPAVDLQSIKDLTPDQLSKIPQYNEIWMQLQVHSHKNVVTVYQVLESSVATFLIMDYYETDLFNSIVNLKTFANDGELIKRTFLQICSAVKYCHETGIYHCDIKPENIVLDNDNNAYLCDFGLATTNPNLSPNTNVGSTYYIAPEKILYFNDHESQSTKLPTKTGDVWSLGILLINLICIRNPWLKAHQTEDKTFFHFVKDSNVLQKILPLSDDLYNLLVKVLQINPFKRISIDELMKEVCLIKSFTNDNGPLSNVPEYTDLLRDITDPYYDFQGKSNEDNYYHYLSETEEDEEKTTETTIKEVNIEQQQLKTVIDNTLYQSSKDISSCVTLGDKTLDNEPIFKSALNMMTYTGLSSDATICGSDSSDYPLLFHDEQRNSTNINDQDDLRVNLSS